MKKILLVLAVTFTVCSFYSCEKTPTENKELLCDNSIKDGDETEIDCGGVCSPCPAPSTFTCTITSLNGLGVQHLTGHSAYGQILGPSIRVSSSNTSNRLLFLFKPGAIGQPSYVSSVSFNFAGEPYTKDDEDTASFVTLTAQDTLRRIISGTFGFRAERITQGNTKCQVSEGVFTNLRYYDL